MYNLHSLYFLSTDALIFRVMLRESFYDNEILYNPDEVEYLKEWNILSLISYVWYF